MKLNCAVLGHPTIVFFIAALSVFLILPSVFAQVPTETSGSQSFDPQIQFTIPDRNGSVGFAENGVYTNATLNDGIWDFTGFSLSSTKTMLPMVSGSDFSIGAQNSNVTVTRFDPINVFPPQGTGYVEYNVLGLGNQTLSIQYGRGYLDYRWVAYSVTIDGKVKDQGVDWNLQSGGWLTINGAMTNVKIGYGMRTPTAFPLGQQFSIPSHNSSVSFAQSGAYIFTEFNGSTWKFQNLALGNNAAIDGGYGNWGLGISAQNSNIKVTNYALNLDTGGWLNYTVNGVGSQTLNFNYARLGSWPINYTVYIDDVKQWQNTSWSVTEDDWLTVTGATANVSITGVQNIPDWVKNMPPPGPPFQNTASGINPGNYTVAFVAFGVVAFVIVLVLRRSKRSKRNTTNNQTNSTFPIEVS